MDINTSRLLEQLVDRIVRAAEPPKEPYACPHCGGRIRLDVEPFFRRNRQILGVRAKCEQCNIEVAIDYAGPLPEWWVRPDEQDAR